MSERSPQLQGEIERAKRLFRSFHEREPVGDEISIVSFPAAQVVVFEVGEALSIGYQTPKNIPPNYGRKFYHEFKSSLPKLVMTPTGTQALIVGGSYRFTSRGFIK